MATELHSVIVPAFNEEAGIEAFYARISKTLRQLPAHEIVFVDDGSVDSTFTILAGLAARDEHVRVVRLARNFGHQTAMTAGIDVAAGDTVTVIDADLQDPPELIPTMIAEWRKGAEVVFAVRRSRAGESTFKRATASAYYRLMRRLAGVDMPLDAADFRLMSRRAAQALRSMREHSRYIRGLVAWMGLSQAVVEYDREARFAGETKYPLRKMLRLATDGIVSFSTVPLRFATYLGFTAAAIGVLYAVYVVYLRVATNAIVEGWASLMVVVLVFGGAQMVTLGIVGEYIGRIYDEARGRPLYLVQEVRGFGEEVTSCYEYSPVGRCAPPTPGS